MPETDPISAVFETVAETAPEIRAGLPGRRRTLDQENETGDTQLAADVWADDLLAERLGELEGIGQYASEERPSIADVGEGYAVAVDPLDGSSNLKSNNPMGTVVGIYEDPLPAGSDSIVAGGYVLYGPITTMVVARDGPPESYVVEEGTPQSTGTVHLPADPTVYGFGGREPDWTPEFLAYVESVREELKLRYGGAMIADVSQVLTYGGIFGYPGLRDRPEGKLRVLFEAAPIGHVVEQAGGASTDGRQSLTSIRADDVHQRIPTFVGNGEYVDRLETALVR